VEPNTGLILFGGMGLDREKERSEKIGEPMELIFPRCSPSTPVWVFFNIRKLLNPSLEKI
jgi:hypothetical protein